MNITPKNNDNKILNEWVARSTGVLKSLSSIYNSQTVALTDLLNMDTVNAIPSILNALIYVTSGKWGRFVSRVRHFNFLNLLVPTSRIWFKITQRNCAIVGEFIPLLYQILFCTTTTDTLAANLKLTRRNANQMPYIFWTCSTGTR